MAKEQADRLALGSEVKLVDEESGELMGILRIEEKFTYDKKLEATHVFRTEDEKHPGVAKALFAI